MSDAEPRDDDPAPGDAGPEDFAAEYALGVLDADAHREAEARAARDPEFAAETQSWCERLSPLIDEVGLLAPSAGLWPRIAAAIGLADARGATVVDLAGRRAADADLARLSRSRAAWRAAALAAFAATLAMVIGLGVLLLGRGVGRTTPRAPLMVASLVVEGAGAPLTAAYDPDRRAVLLAAPAGLAPRGQTPELWALDAAGTPYPLGLLADGQPSLLTLTPATAAHVRPSAVLAISIEPAGGSLSGKPTGPVVAKGALRAL